jgi:hypothetical protein
VSSCSIAQMRVPRMNREFMLRRVAGVGLPRRSGEYTSPQLQDVSCGRTANPSKPFPFIEPRRLRILSTKTYAAEVLEGETQKSIQQGSADSAVAPCLPDINAPYASHCWIAQKRILVESAHCDQETAIEVAAESLAWAIEPIFSGDPLIQQSVQEPISVSARLSLHFVQAGRRELDCLYQKLRTQQRFRHRFRISWLGPLGRWRAQ